MQMAKKPSLEIESIDLSVNTSSNVLQDVGIMSLDRVEMDRMTLYNSLSLSGFAYDKQAFRKFRHYACVKVEDLSGVFSSPGVRDPMTIQGKVRVRNNTDVVMGNHESDLYIIALYTNKRLTLMRTSASLESVTISKEAGGGIRTGVYSG